MKTKAGALLLCAGIGSRLAPLTNFIPKCLMPIAGFPLLAYWIELLARHDVNPIVVNVHYLKDQVLDFISQSPYRDRIHIFHETTLLGTGGTLKKTGHFFERGPVLVAHADNLSLFDPGQFLERHAERSSDCIATMMTFDTDRPQECGIVETDPQGRVVQFYEKVKNPPHGRANAAVYLVEREFIDLVNSCQNDFIDLSTEILPNLLGKISTFHNSRYHRDIGTVESWLRANVEAPLVSDFFSFWPREHHNYRFRVEGIRNLLGALDTEVKIKKDG